MLGAYRYSVLIQNGDEREVHWTYANSSGSAIATVLGWYPGASSLGALTGHQDIQEFDLSGFDNSQKGK